MVKLTKIRVLMLLSILSFLSSCTSPQEVNYNQRPVTRKKTQNQTTPQQQTNPANTNQNNILNSGNTPIINSTNNSGNNNVTNNNASEGSPVNIGEEPNSYLSVRDIAGLFDNWESKAAGLVESNKYATVNGLDAVYLRVSTAVKGSSSNLPRVMITAATHGDEPISTATVIGVAYRFISQYGKDSAITNLINTRDIYFVPTVCPDGYENNSREVEGGVDPNRAFPSPTEPGRSSPDCVSSIISFFNSKQFNATIDYHASGGMMMYPWGYQESPIEDDRFSNAYKTIAKKMSDVSGYRWGQITEMVGYLSEGSSADYFYWHGNQQGWGTFSFAVEAGQSKQPPESEISSEAEANFGAIKAFIEDAPLVGSTWASYSDAPTPPQYNSISPYFVPGQE